MSSWQGLVLLEHLSCRCTMRSLEFYLTCQGCLHASMRRTSSLRRTQPLTRAYSNFRYLVFSIIAFFFLHLLEESKILMSLLCFLPLHPQASTHAPVPFYDGPIFLEGNTFCFMKITYCFMMVLC